MQHTDSRLWDKESSTPAAIATGSGLSRSVLYALDGVRTHGLSFFRDALVVMAAFFAADLARFDGHIRQGYDVGLVLSFGFLRAANRRDRQEEAR